MEDLLSDGSLDRTGSGHRGSPTAVNELRTATGTYRTAIDRNLHHGLTISRQTSRT
jgi:hypothetical protein